MMTIISDLQSHPVIIAILSAGAAAFLVYVYFQFKFQNEQYEVLCNIRGLLRRLVNG